MKKISNLAKKMDGVVRFYKGVLILTEIVLVIMLVIMLGFEDSFFVSGNFDFSLAFVDFQFAEAYTPDLQTMKFYFIGMMVLGIVILAFTYYEAVIIRRIIKPMTEERPFDSSVAKNIRLLAWIILIGEGIFSALYFALEVFEYHAFDYENIFLSDKIISVSADYDFNVTFVWIFFVVYLLSYVFQYGQELQIQSDETL